MIIGYLYYVMQLANIYLHERHPIDFESKKNYDPAAYVKFDACSLPLDMPSDHMAFAVWACFHFANVIYNTVLFDFESGICLLVVLCVFVFPLWPMFIAFAGIFLGQTSLSQLLLGILVGFWIFTIELGLKTTMTNYYNLLIKKVSENTTIRNQMYSESIFVACIQLIMILPAKAISGFIYSKNGCDENYDSQSKYVDSDVRLMVMTLFPYFVNFVLYNNPIKYCYNEFYYAKIGFLRLVCKLIVNILLFSPLLFGIYGWGYSGLNIYIQIQIGLVINYLTAQLFIKVNMIISFRIGAQIKGDFMYANMEVDEEKDPQSSQKIYSGHNNKNNTGQGIIIQEKSPNKRIKDDFDPDKEIAEVLPNGVVIYKKKTIDLVVKDFEKMNSEHTIEKRMSTPPIDIMIMPKKFEIIKSSDQIKSEKSTPPIEGKQEHMTLKVFQRSNKDDDEDQDEKFRKEGTGDGLLQVNAFGIQIESPVQKEEKFGFHDLKISNFEEMNEQPIMDNSSNVHMLETKNSTGSKDSRTTLELAENKAKNFYLIAPKSNLNDGEPNNQKFQSTLSFGGDCGEGTPKNVPAFGRDEINPQSSGLELASFGNFADIRNKQAQLSIGNPMEATSILFKDSELQDNQLKIMDQPEQNSSSFVKSQYMFDKQDQDHLTFCGEPEPITSDSSGLECRLEESDLNSQKKTSSGFVQYGKGLNSEKLKPFRSDFHVIYEAENDNEKEDCSPAYDKMKNNETVTRDFRKSKKGEKDDMLEANYVDQFLNRHAKSNLVGDFLDKDASMNQSQLEKKQDDILEKIANI